MMTWRQQGTAGYRKLQLKAEGPNGTKSFFCYLNDLRVDAPITLAKFITDKTDTINIGKADKTLVKWTHQMITDNSKLICLAWSFEERNGIVGKVDNCNQGDTSGSISIG
jgi:hypothetical protein